MYQAAADATKHKPPNTVDFHGVCDGRLIASKPRGRTGPRAQVVNASTTNDATTLLMAAMLPLLTSLSESHKRHRSLSPPTTPSQHSGAVLFPLSPLPAVGSELRACLSDFAEASGIDITACENPLMALELTPDIIPDVPITRLCALTDTVEGRMRKF